MKQVITKRLSLVIAGTMLFVLLLNLFLQIEDAHEHMARSANETLDRIEEILATNSDDLEHLTESLKEEYIVRARAVAYVVCNHPERENDVDELRKMAALLQVDEICLFDREGTIYSGTHPEYNGLSMISGDQISFFLPMLSDESLVLCQDVMPNTALGKPMMYAAVWREDGKGIVQVGLEPRRLVEASKKNEISYIFANLTMQEKTCVVAVEQENGQIIASTREDLREKNLDDLNLVIPEKNDVAFHVRVNGIMSSAVFREYDGNKIGMIWESSILYADLWQSMLLVLLYLTVAAVMMIAAILSNMDYLVIDSINAVNAGLSEIAAGKLDTKISVDNLPEFVSLSNRINLMTESLLNNTVKISRILDATDAQIGLFEYNSEKSGVLTTRKLAAILMISPEEMAEIIEDKEKFRAKIADICSHPVSRCKNIYSLPTETACYVKLESYEEAGTTFGVVMDVTEEIVEKERLRHERDHDLLTQLLCRRAFYRGLDDLFDESPQKIGEAVMLMFDLDGLKWINDNCGHAGGDKAIREVARLLSGIEHSSKVVARLSGDEFAVFLYGAREREELQMHIDALYERMQAAEVEVFDRKIPVRLSGGYVFYPEYQEGYTALLRKADQALYYSKNNGKARFSAYQKEFENKA